MARQTFPVGAPSVDQGTTLQWGTDSAPVGLQIDHDLLAVAGDGFLSRIRTRTFGDMLVRTGATALSAGDEAGPNLSDTWRNSAVALVFEAGGQTWTLPGPGNIDSVEPYFWLDDAATTFVNGYRALTAAEQAGTTVTLDDDALILDRFDRTGRDVDALALITANLVPRGDQNTLYADANRGGTDAVDDGELGLGAGETLITRIEFIPASGQVRLNDNDVPEALSFTAYFAPVGGVSERYLTFQTAAGEVSTNVVASTGDGFVRMDFSGEANLPVLSDIVDGTLFLVGVWRAENKPLGGGVPGGVSGAAAGLRASSIVNLPVGGHVAVGRSAATGGIRAGTLDRLPVGGVSGAGRRGASAGLLAQVVPALDTLIEPPPPRFPVIDVPARAELLLPQYADAENLQRLVRELNAVVNDRIVAPLLILERAMNPDESRGIVLDWIGQRLGLPRPSVASADAVYWGFDGTFIAGGRSLSQAPFRTRSSILENLEPLGDRLYRLLLKGRARRLRGGADRETIEAVLGIMFGNGYLDESVSPMQSVVSTTDDLLYSLVNDALFAALVPRPAGRPMTMRRV